MSARNSPVVDLATPESGGPIARLIERLRRVLGWLLPFSSVTLLAEYAGVTVTNAAADPGTALTLARTLVNLADAGADQARVVVRGNNSAAGNVTVQVYDVTNSVVLCTVTVTGTTVTTYAGDWVNVSATGEDHEIEPRVIGDGAFDPVVYRIELQLRTLKARS